MENGLQLFSNSGLGQVRVIIDENNEPWFVASDIAQALGYSEESKAARLFSRVPEDWKGVKPIHTLGGNQDTTMLSEQGLYFFLGRSDKHKALPFQKWLAGEVLPSIRKTGSYSLLPKDYASALRALAAEVEEKERIALERDEAIRTKAYISNKREASVMGKLSGMSRKVAALEDRLGEGANWKACTAIPWLDAWFDVERPGFYSQLGRYLTKLSVQLGYETGTVEHPKYGTVKSYHTDVIYELSVRLTNGVVILPKYHIDD